jgi:hypothetical protein
METVPHQSADQTPSSGPTSAAQPQAQRRKYNRQQKELLLILLGQFVICLVIWHSVHFGHLTQGIAVAWFVTDFVTAAALRLLQVIRGILIVFGVVAAATAASLIAIVFELLLHPDLQALYLLHLAVTIVVSAFAGVIGVGFASTFRPTVEYKDED